MPKRSAKNPRHPAFKKPHFPSFWWGRVAERLDPSCVGQENSLFCVPACLQMLLEPYENDLNQRELAAQLLFDDELGINPIYILPCLIGLHGADTWKDRLFPSGATLSQLPTPFLTFMLTHEKPSWHAVIVDSRLPSGSLRIRDPLNATSYRMKPSWFYEAWAGYVIFRDQPPSITEKSRGNPRPRSIQ